MAPALAVMLLGAGRPGPAVTQVADKFGSRVPPLSTTVAGGAPSPPHTTLFQAELGFDADVEPTSASVSTNPIVSNPTDTSPSTGPTQAAAPASPAHCLVPRLAGKTLKGAKKALRRDDCTLGKLTKIAGATATAGKVTGQKPKPGSVLAAGAKVKVTLKP
ncbi:MAG TPA: PASTA domain-containing protein [Solirubrobacterales bacterium]|nr:PASTA domain-containing protein [Solirubrobacterales bacterium]